MGRVKRSDFKRPRTLLDVGNDIAVYFEHILRLLSSGASENPVGANQIILEEQRFRLWAGNLGLHQHGHSSLDYRLRDADVVRSYALDLLTGIKEYLLEVFNIVSGSRVPYEQSYKPANNREDQGVFDHQVLGKESYSSGEPTEDSSSNDSESSISGSDGPIDELSLRVQGIVERIDSLYSLATKIRNPSTRPVRPTAELYKHCLVDDVADYIQERVGVETQVVSHILLQHLMQFEPPEVKQRLVRDRAERDEIDSGDEAESESESEQHSRTSQDSFNHEVAANVSSQASRLAFANEADWLIRRLGKANARRRQQFVYWKEHAQRIAGPKPKPDREEQMPIEMKPNAAAKQLEVTDANPIAKSQAHSNPTIATLLDPKAVRLDDTKSVMTRSSRMSTVASGVQTEALSWPDPPSVDSSGNYFVCEYCMLLCPPQYLSREKWINHMKHDLQPYQCTYPDCEQPDRLYASRQEWINHEGLAHTRVWICTAHLSQEFETQPDYLEHLKEEHAKEPEQQSPELVAACMQPSSVPHRGCPFCPVEFASVMEMNSHVSHHLERFALLVLPKQTELDEESGDDGRGSVQTKDAAVRAVRPTNDDDSRAGDFDLSMRLSIDENTSGYINFLQQLVPSGDGPAKIRLPDPERRAGIYGPPWEHAQWNSLHFQQQQEVLTRLGYPLSPDETQGAHQLVRENLDNFMLTSPWFPEEQTEQTDVASWLDETREDTGDDYNLQGDLNRFLPRRLINVTQDDDKDVRLETSDMIYEGKYACLSDLDEGDQFVFTDRSNLTDRLSSLASSHWSFAIWLAIRACRKLGIPYLWATELCLLDEDSEDNQWYQDNKRSIWKHAAAVWDTRSEIPQEDDKLLRLEAEAYFSKRMRGPDDECKDRSPVQIRDFPDEDRANAIEAELIRLRGEIARNQIERDLARRTAAREEEVRRLDRRIQDLNNDVDRQVRRSSLSEGAGSS